MAVKTITIDLEAYERLKNAKRPEESFSQAIKRLVRPPFDFDAWMKKIRSDPLSPEAVEAIEQVIKNRRHPSNRIR